MIKQLLSAFSYALNGLSQFFKNERNGQIQLAIAAMVVLAGWGLSLSLNEWMVVAGCIATVLAFEMVNTCIEKLCNMIHPGFHPSIKYIKDVSAAAVLLISVASAIFGAIIFLPKFFKLL